MPAQGFSVGKDISVDVVTTRGVQRWSLITGFQSTPQNVTRAIKGLDGIVRNLSFPDGWSGRFRVERQGNDVDNYFADAEARYYNGENEGYATITETISEPDGSVSQYRYTNVALTWTNRDEWAADNTINQEISFAASRRVKA